MSHRNEKDIPGKQLHRLAGTAADILTWFVAALNKIRGMIPSRRQPSVAVPPGKPAQQHVVTPPNRSEDPRVVTPLETAGRPRVFTPVKKAEGTHVATPPKTAEGPPVVTPPNRAAGPGVVVPQKGVRKPAERPALPARCIVFSDTENGIDPVINTLRFTGILLEKGRLADELAGLSIFHTGDLIDKKRPDPAVVEYWQQLRRDALAKGGQVRLIAGNHELEIWQKIRSGEKFGMSAGQLACINSFIESLDLFHVAGPVLFMHGYPTLEFLQTLLHFRETTGKTLNCFNTDHYKKAFKSVNASKQYAYVRRNRRANYLLYDVADASRYYKKQGREVGAVLSRLNIDTVVHGHRPQRSGVQADNEYLKWIPKVRMIGNDTMVRRRGLGATIIRHESGGELDVVFINTKTESRKLRKKVQKDLGEVLGSPCAYRAAGRVVVPEKSTAHG
jgi:hypothetical protein